MTEDEVWADIEERRQAAQRRQMLTIHDRGGSRQIPLYGPGESQRRTGAPVQSFTPAPMQIDAPTPVQTVQKLATSHVDRAKGFSIVSIPLAAGVGLGGLLLAVGVFAVPVFSMAALLTLFLAFLATWLAAWLWYQSASPDGVTLWTVLLHYRLLSREQKARLRRMEDDE